MWGDDGCRCRPCRINVVKRRGGRNCRHRRLLFKTNGTGDIIEGGERRYRCVQRNVIKRNWSVTASDGVSLVQPYRSQIPAPNGQMVGRVDFLADVDTSIDEFVRSLFNVRRRYSHDIKLFISNLEIGDGIHL